MLSTSVSAAQLRGTALPVNRSRASRRSGRVAVSAQASGRQGAEAHEITNNGEQRSGWSRYRSN